jgi:hypothetical protein
MRQLPFLILLACLVRAQAPAPQASIRGRVMDSLSGKGLAGAIVVTGKARITTGADGGFLLANLPPGPARITASTRDKNYPEAATKSMVLVRGQEMELNLSLTPAGMISGKVLNKDDEPIRGVSVRALSRLYGAGRLHYVSASEEETTDERGEFTLRVSGDEAVVVLAGQSAVPALAAISSSAGDPQLRPAMIVPTFHPDVLSPELAPMISIGPGGHAAAVDIRLRELPSRCIEGQIPGSNSLAITRLGQTLERVFRPTGAFGSDGKFRICGLYSGEYRISATDTASPLEMPAWMGDSIVVVADSDVSGINFPVQPPEKIAGVVELENPPEGTVISSPLSVGLVRESRSQKESNPLQVAVPGEFFLDVFPAAEYVFAVNQAEIPTGWYLKDLTYAGTSIMRRLFRPRIPNAVLRVTLAHDGSAVLAKVAGKDGRSIPDITVALVPELPLTDAELAGSMIVGTTDHSGTYTSGTLRPGKYWIIATPRGVTRGVDSVASLLRSRDQAKPVVVVPGEIKEIALEPLILVKR